MSGTSRADYATAGIFTPPDDACICKDRRESEIQKQCKSVIQGKRVHSDLRREEMSFSLPRKVAMHLKDRRSCGKEFHSFGAANLNERLPMEDLMSGTERRLVPDE